MTELSAYHFAASDADARRNMAWYAAMFDTGPVVDVGAGPGHFLVALRNRGIEGVGVDLRQESVDAGRQRGVETVLGDATEFLLSRPATFGGAFISHVVEHMDPPRVEALLQALATALRPGATVVIVTPNPRDLLVLGEIFWLDPTHVRPYPLALLDALLHAAGFTVVGSGRRALRLGRRSIPVVWLNRLRFGGDYARGEAWIRAILQVSPAMPLSMGTPS